MPHTKKKLFCNDRKKPNRAAPVNDNYLVICPNEFSNFFCFSYWRQIACCVVTNQEYQKIFYKT